jgi:hypothetical protein
VASGDDVAHNAFVNNSWIDAGAVNCLAHSQRSELRSGEPSKRTLKFSNRRAYCRDDDYVFHNYGFHNNDCLWVA